MNASRKALLIATGAAFCLMTAVGFAQDAPALGDLARQQRQQRSKASDPNGKPAKVITNEQIPSHPTDEQMPVTAAPEHAATPSSGPETSSAGQMKAQVLAQQNQIAGLQTQLDSLNESIRFAPGNCVRGCAEWNEHQREKQQQAERLQSQLAEEKKRLEEIQESARKQGLGSAVYEP